MPDWAKLPASHWAGLLTMHHTLLKPAVNPLDAPPTAVVVHGDPTPLLAAVKPVLVLLEVDLHVLGFPDI